MLKLIMAKIEQEIELQSKEGRPAEILIRLNNHKIQEVSSTARIAKKKIDLLDGEIYFKKEIWRCQN